MAKVKDLYDIKFQRIIDTMAQNDEPWGMDGWESRPFPKRHQLKILFSNPKLKPIQLWKILQNKIKPIIHKSITQIYSIQYLH